MATSEREFRTVVMAGLLHDVGKLLQRGDGGPLAVGGKHPQVSADFVRAFRDRFARCVDADLLETLVQRHHESPSFPDELRVQTIADPHVRARAYLVSRADSLASAERGDRSLTYRDYKTARLAAAFGRIDLGTDGANSTPLYYAPRPLGGLESLDALFGEPGDQHEPGQMRALIAGFGEAFRRLADTLAWDAFDVAFTHLLAFLQRFAWCIPADTQEERPDVSLYDHLKATAAIAAALYRYHEHGGDFAERAITRPREGEERFCLIVGDVSGIQSYLFDLAAHGSARRLRARSLAIQLTSDAVALQLLDELRLPLCNLLFSSGGKFYVLAPNTPGTERSVEEARASADARLLDATNGELAINLAAVTFGDAGFGGGAGEGFGDVLERIARALNERKQRRYTAALQVGGATWAEDAFVRPTSYTGDGACVSCHKLPRGHDGLCATCQRDTALGRALPRGGYLVHYRDERGRVALLGRSADVVADPSDVASDAALVVRLNEADLEPVAGVPVAFRYLASHVPPSRTDPSFAADFDELAKRSSGRELLGFLKLDADRLGEALVFGLKREPPAPSYDTVSRLATLSRQLDLFFSGWVQRIVTREYPDCYTVFAGGDDLFVVGPWSALLPLAERVRADYQRFSGHPGLTVSAGLALTKPRYPIRRAAALAESGTERAKAAGRDRLALLGAVLGWDEASYAQREAATLGGFRPTSALLYSLRRYGAMWRAFASGEDPLAIRFQPLLAYTIARNVSQRDQPGLHGWLSGLLGLRPGDAAWRRKLDNLALIAELALMAQRGG